MNLIEQLGGYKNAKRFLGDILDNKSPCEILTRELLEHRRQHNIFEIGDNVVFDSKYSKDSKVFKIDSDRSGKMGIRHATDAEIKAGRRL